MRGIPKCLLFKSLIKSEGSFINVVTHFYFSLSSAPFPLYHTPMPLALCTFYKMTRPPSPSLRDVIYECSHFNYLKNVFIFRGLIKMAFSLGSATRQRKEEETKTKASKTSTGYFCMLSNKCCGKLG